MKVSEYLLPRTVAEALEMRERTDGRFVAGGTDLLVKLRKRHVPPPPALVSLRRIPDLTGVSFAGTLRLGAATPLDEVLGHPGLAEAFPALAAALRAIGSAQIRSVATPGGNLCNASPASDLMPPLLVHEARVELAGPSGTRTLPLRDLCSGPGRTCLQGGELLQAILVDRRPEAATAYLRKNRVRMDLAQASVAVLLEVKGGTCVKARVAAGAVAPTALRLESVEALLEGQKLEEGLLEEAGREAARSTSPITDLRATAEYRRHIIGVLFKRAAEAALASRGKK